MRFDPALIKLGFFGLVVVARAVSAAGRKQKTTNRALRPSQSSAPQQPIAPPPSIGKQSPPQKPVADSPWTSTKGPFD